jgi:hypothetical protein
MVCPQRILKANAAIIRQEQADLEAHEDAAERFYANREAENEREAFALYLADQEREEEVDLKWYYDEAEDNCVFGINGDWC